MHPKASNPAARQSPHEVAQRVNDRLLASWGKPSEWSRRQTDSGLAHGWHGPAWIHLHLIRRSLISETPSAIDAVVRRLGNSKSTGTRTSVLIGSGADAVVSSLAATITGDRALAERHLRQWLTRARSSEHSDVMSGVAGAILAACEIERHGVTSVPRNRVEQWRDAVQSIVQAAVDGRRQRVKLGLAHGLSGHLLALENARSVYGLTTDRRLTRAALRLLRRAALVAPLKPPTLVWPIEAHDVGLNAHGWCHGAPGIALALACCATLSNFEPYQELSELALRGAALVINRHASICCGLSGQASVMVEAYRLTEDKRWLRYARRALGAIGPSDEAAIDTRRSLWRGSSGPAFAALRLSCPDVPFPALGALSA